MPLNIAQIKAAKPADKPVRMFDEKGLYLEISPTGSKLWRWKYRFNARKSAFLSARGPRCLLLMRVRKLSKSGRFWRKGLTLQRSRKHLKLSNLLIRKPSKKSLVNGTPHESMFGLQGMPGGSCGALKRISSLGLAFALSDPCLPLNSLWSFAGSKPGELLKPHTAN